ncbi:hypothetical protein BT96DRAFT_889382 [Gymnopus androsaceus JB14]|uniref:F-box domain-containing protein n=1 Tax=Gymnopus androsaceus JB14 TaxID=1447944 RepID=A0A6A4GWS9_9AGAR|nr:hypothetical protein BT96DRAFT_889382 [Gymnopus androsaceus JB14]
MTEFPVEILDYILVFLAENSQDLANLALVSSLFLQCSRPRYFQSIIITPGNVQQLASLLKSPHQTISGYIRSVILEGRSDEQSSKALLGQLRSIAASIGDTVVSLSFLYLDFQTLQPDIYQPPLSGFPIIQSLELGSIAFKSVSQMMNMLCIFRVLQTASLNNLSWDDPSNDTVCTVFSYDVSPTLDMLYLESCYKRDIIRCLLSQDPLPTIRELDVGIVSPSDTEAIGEYISRIGPHLSFLSLGFSSLDAGGDAEDFYCNSDLSLNTGLKSIHFDRLVYFAEYRLTNPWLWISKIISTLCSAMLTHVCFSVYIPLEDPLDYLDFCWPEMDQLFAKDITTYRLPHFECLQLRLCFPHIPESDVLRLVIASIKRNLPLCDQGGVLQFDVVHIHCMEELCGK